MRKVFQKTDISYPLIHPPTCAYQGVKNSSFSENFVYVPNEWSLKELTITQSQKKVGDGGNANSMARWQYF